jgi:GntP family gluconate:H+ symporter
MHADQYQLIWPVLTIILLVLLITRLRLHAFLALILSAGFLGLGSGIAPVDVVKHFQKGFGDVLSSLGLVIGLGVMLGGLLLESGGGDRIATAFIGLGTRRWIPTAICAAALLIGMPHIFDVSFVMLVPLLYVIAKRVDYPIMGIGIPMVAGLLVSHTVLVPHPAPMLALTVYHADAGRAFFYGLIIAIPMALITGPLFSMVLSRWCPVNGSFAGAEQAEGGGAAIPLRDLPGHRAPSLFLSIVAVLLPPGLMMLRTFGHSHLDPHGTMAAWLDFIGNPFVSLLIAVLFAFYFLGVRSGLDLTQIQKLLRNSVGPAAGIILIIGAGGGLSEMLKATHISGMIAQWEMQSGINPLVMAWVTAALVRICIGSATVATVTAAGMMAPLAVASPNVSLELMVIATASGAQMLSHLNDTGFWLFKEYFKLSIGETLRSWSLLTSLQSVLGLIGVLAINALIH